MYEFDHVQKRRDCPNRAYNCIADLPQGKGKTSAVENMMGNKNTHIPY